MKYIHVVSINELTYKLKSPKKSTAQWGTYFNHNNLNFAKYSRKSKFYYSNLLFKLPVFPQKNPSKKSLTDLTVILHMTSGKLCLRRIEDLIDMGIQKPMIHINLIKKRRSMLNNHNFKSAHFSPWKSQISYIKSIPCSVFKEVISSTLVVDKYHQGNGYPTKCVKWF